MHSNFVGYVMSRLNYSEYFFFVIGLCNNMISHSLTKTKLDEYSVMMHTISDHTCAMHLINHLFISKELSVCHN